MRVRERLFDAPNLDGLLSDHRGDRIQLESLLSEDVTPPLSHRRRPLRENASLAESAQAIGEDVRSDRESLLECIEFVNAKERLLHE